MRPLNDYVIIEKIKQTTKIAGEFELNEDSNEITIKANFIRKQ